MPTVLLGLSDIITRGKNLKQNKPCSNSCLYLHLLIVAHIYILSTFLIFPGKIMKTNINMSNLHMKSVLFLLCLVISGGHSALQPEFIRSFLNR